MAGDLFAGHVLVFLFCVSTVASVLVFCVSGALMSICLDPTHLVTWLLINFPQLLSLITLIICSLYNLVFAVPCGFVTICWVVYVLCPVQSSPVQSSPVQSSPVQSSPVQSSQLFPYGVVFVCLFVLFCLSLLLKVLVLPPAFGSSPHPFPQPWQKQVYNLIFL